MHAPISPPEEKETQPQEVRSRTAFLLQLAKEQQGGIWEARPGLDSQPLYLRPSSIGGLSQVPLSIMGHFRDHD